MDTSTITATVNAAGHGTLVINGHPTPIAEASVEEARAVVIAEAAELAGKLGRPVKLLSHDPEGSWPLLVHPDAHVEPQTPPEESPDEEEIPPASQSSDVGLDGLFGGAVAKLEAKQVTENDTSTTAVVSSHRAGRPSFITAGRTMQPATQGMRGALNRVGLRLDPGPVERAYRDDVAAVAQHWPGPRTVAIVNGKGSASKTPTTACLAAVFARLGGAGVLAWDNNETRGSLPWRTETTAHAATVLDLLPRVDALLAQTAQYAEVGHFVHHQPADKYDVLWSDQSIEGDHVVSADEVERVHQVASRYYRLTITDSGNSESAPNWRAMVAKSALIVVPCTNVEDTAEAGARLLEALAARDDHCAQLARDAVVVVSQRTPGRDPDMERIVAGWHEMGRNVVTIPFDPALKTGVIRFDALRPVTQRAWLAAAAAVARGL